MVCVCRLKNEQEVLAYQAQAELERQQALERQEMLKQCKENERKLTEIAQQELAMAKEAALRLKVIFLCISLLQPTSVWIDQFINALLASFNVALYLVLCESFGFRVVSMYVSVCAILKKI